ncbi:MAG: hypothetical protein L3J39_13160 [Verrucomicrobiales bacterium]|nr:hypothetical protein [Verrucomicrobiales bacterium]
MGSENTLHELTTVTRQYLDTTLALHPDVLNVEPPAGVKIGVKNRYQYHQIILYGKSLLLCTPKQNVEWTPKKIADDFITLNAAGHLPVLLVARITAITRTRLIERQVDFIAPGKQLHLPSLLICLSDYGLPHKHKKAHAVSPSAQHLLLYLYQSQHTPTGHSTWSNLFDYSRITIHRALQDLTNINAVKTNRKGKLLQIELTEPGYQGFTNLVPHLKSPTSKTFHLAGDPSILDTLATPAGYTALSNETDILDNSIPTFAISKSAFQANKNLLGECTSSDSAQAVCLLEVWSYAPTLPLVENTTTDHPLDKLSLYLSMKDIADERTESALEQLMNNIAWHKD